MRIRKAHLISALLPSLAIELPAAGKADAHPKLNPQRLFEHGSEIIRLEIGFGGGEHLAEQASRHPHIGFIGCEPFVNGIASLLDHIDRRAIRNIRIFPGDARALLEAMPNASVARIDLLFPDPWPKARHAERRFINPANCRELARVLSPRGDLRTATDDPNLKKWIHEIMAKEKDFEKLFESAEPPPDWVPTRYQEKSLKAGRQPLYFGWRRNTH